jgi:hypothetical protein
MEINWTTLTYAVIALFAISGFFKGWWKEAITALFLAGLMLMLRTPDLAQAFVDGINWFIELIWGIIPDSLLPTVEQVFDVSPGVIPYLDAGDPGTWLVMLIFFLLLSIIIGRSSLPNYGSGRGYEVRPPASVLGGLLGGLNGFILMGLIREYLNGSNLPGGGPASLPTEVVESGGSVAGVASTDVVIKAVDIPAFTLLDSYLPWVLVGLGVVVFFMAITSRVAISRNKGFVSVKGREPYGYRQYGS